MTKLIKTEKFKIALIFGDAKSENVLLREALSKLVLMARTSGAVAGRDAELCDACDEAEALLNGIHEAANA